MTAISPSAANFGATCLAIADMDVARQMTRCGANRPGLREFSACATRQTTCFRDSARRNRRAAVRFFRKLLKHQGCAPRRLITDKLRSYPAACRTVMPSVVHCTDQYANNRAEVSHQATRQRERQMRRFKSAGHLQRFATVHGAVQNLFRVGRHLLRATHHRLLRTRAFVEWEAVTCAYQ